MIQTSYIITTEEEKITIDRISDTCIRMTALTVDGDVSIPLSDQAAENLRDVLDLIYGDTGEYEKW